MSEARRRELIDQEGFMGNLSYESEIAREKAAVDRELTEQQEFIAWLKKQGIYNSYASVGAMRQMQTVWRAAMQERDKERLKFSINEQNCLSLLCQAMSAANYQINEMGKSLHGVHVAAIEDVVEAFPSTNWGDLYDRFHRQGLNS